MKKTLFALAFLAFIACNNKPEGNVVITGYIENGSGKTLYIEQLSFTPKTFKDSVILGENGELSKGLNVPEKGFYKIGENKNNYVIIILDTIDQLEIRGDFKNLAETYQVKNNKESELLASFNVFMKTSAKKVDSLQMIFQQNQNNPNILEIEKQLQQAYGEEMNKRDAYFVEFVKNNSSSFASLAVAEQLPPDNNLELLKTLADGLAKTNPNSEYVVTFQTRVNELSKIAVGTIAPEIALNSPEAKVIKLSELRGKYVLIDFWASWCKPCREENPNVKKVYEKYKSKGFEIYGVSLDKEKNAWVEAIKKDQINWLHVSDLGFWNSSVVKQYNISGIPLTVLIDKEGKIIAKNLRGQSLEAKLAEIFGI